MPETRNDFVSLIVLAAGLSTRFGRNKLVEPIGSRTMIERVVSECLLSKAKQVIVVVGHEKDKIRQKLENYTCEIVVNEDFEKGQTSSIKIGLSKVSRSAAAVVVLPGDIAMANHLIINAVIDEHIDTNALIVTAAHHGHPGHPILFDTKILDELKGINEDTMGLRSVVSRHKSEVRAVETSEAALIDIDKQSDLERLAKYSSNS